MKQNMALAFLQELLQRFFTKSPLFFRIWQWISATAAIITGIPPLLVQWGITLPAPWDIASNKFIAALTTGMWVMSRLTTQSAIVAGKDGEPPLKQTSAGSLPFTAATEIKNTTEVLSTNTNSQSK